MITAPPTRTLQHIISPSQVCQHCHALLISTTGQRAQRPQKPAVHCTNTLQFFHIDLKGSRQSGDSLLTSDYTHQSTLSVSNKHTQTHTNSHKYTHTHTHTYTGACLIPRPYLVNKQQPVALNENCCIDLGPWAGAHVN